MKKTRRFAATIAAMALAATMVAPTMMNTFAADPVTITITENGSASAGEFAAYKILNASVSGNAYTYSLNDKYVAVAAAAGVTGTEDQVIDYISGLDAAGMRTFADAVYKKILEAGIAPDATSTNGAFSVEQGYYLIAEKGEDPSGETFSLVMIDTAGNDAVEIAAKKSAPSFQKKIMDKNDCLTDDDGSTNDEWQDSADYDGGDNVPFQLTATLPDDLASYDHYSLNFYDNLEDSVFGYVDGSAKVYLVHEGNAPVEIENGFEIITDNSTDETFTATQTVDKSVNLKVSIADLMAISGISPVAGDKIVVEYEATLNANTAVIGPTGNWNSAYLEYSNNPYNSGAGLGEEGSDNTSSKTPEDLVVAFTYKLEVAKVDGEGEALEGAEFQLYKENEDGGYVLVGEPVPVGNIFTFNRIDAGNYKLVESVVPAGYKKADDVYFTVKAEHQETADIPELTNLRVYEYDPDTQTVGSETSEFNVNIGQGKIDTAIENTSGSKLPGTGGMGTKLFIAGGGITATLAALYLVTKKRSGKEEE